MGSITVDNKGLNSAFSLDMLVKGATECASRFIAPVYLVGSALVSDDPLDLDIVLVLSYQQFWKLIGCTPDGFTELYHRGIYHGPYERMARLVKKWKYYFEAFSMGMDVDFKVQIIDEFKKHTGLRVRIDQLQNVIQEG